MYSSFVFILSFLLLAYIWQFTIIVEKKFMLSKLKKEKLELQKRLSQLELVYNKLSSVSRVEKIAKTKLNMVYPKKIHFLVIPDDK